jgi:hypothetical protein
MVDLRFGRHVLGVCAAFAMLIGCGGRAGNGVVPAGSIPNDLPGLHTFYYTGGAQDFRVPAGVTHIRVIARGGKGAGATLVYPGRVRASIRVKPGERLVVYVGGDASGSTGGFNGGGTGGIGGYYCYSVSCSGFGGGGSSDIRAGGDELTERILVAAGGGGQGGNRSGQGGAGGLGGASVGGAGHAGSGYGAGGGGGGGTQYSGGSAGSGGYTSGSTGGPGSVGSTGQGGSGGEGSQGCCYPAGAGGGGGGGGYYGGGGGGAGSSYFYGGESGGGGGGGSSYVEPDAEGVHMWQGWDNPAANGLVVFSW